MKSKFWTALFTLIMLSAVVLSFVVLRTTVSADNKTEIEVPEYETSELMYQQPSGNVNYPMDECWIVVDINLRDKPSLDAKIIGSKSAYTRVIVDKIKGNWAHLQYVDAWVFAGYLTSIEPIEYYTISTNSLDAAKYAGYTIDTFALMPSKIQHIIKNYDIVLTSDAIPREDAPEESITLGYTVVKNSGTTRQITLLANDHYLKDTILHETGHVIDQWYAEHHRGTYFSQTEEMLTALQSEAEKISSMLISPLRQTMITTNQELFAEIYRLYVNSPEKLQEVAPQSYELLQNFLSTI